MSAATDHRTKIIAELDGLVALADAAPAPTPTPTPTPTPGPTPSSIPTDAKWIATSGSDSNAGTQGSAWKTMQKAIDAVSGGGTIVIKSGGAGARGTQGYLRTSNSGTPDKPVSIIGEPGAKQPFYGSLYVEGSNVRISNVLFDGPTGVIAAAQNAETAQVAIYGGNVHVTGCTVRNNGSRAGIYVFSAGEVRIERNYIHDNGSKDPTQANLEHGIYWDKGNGRILNNIIVNNVAWGVHFYQQGADVECSNNLIVGHGRGGIILSVNARNIRCQNNIVTGNVKGIWPYALTGTGNVVKNNVLWANQDANKIETSAGLTTTGTIVADPLVVNFKPQTGSPALNKAIPLPVVTVDYDAKPRSTTTPDIGPYEVA